MFLDEGIHTGLAHALRQRGFDVVHAQDLNRKGISDREQLAFAVHEERCLVTFNIRDFVLLHNQYVAKNKDHWGIIVSQAALLLINVGGENGMSRICELPDAVGAIRVAVAAVRSIHANKRCYDGHDVVNWLNEHRNNQLNEIIDCYRNTTDPVHHATIQIGKFLKNHLDQQKIGTCISGRRITLRDGSNRNGNCAVSQWSMIQVPSS